jgi:hypothetical protein
MPRLTRPAFVCVLTLTLAAVEGHARAETPRACVEAVERGQSLRDKVKLREAKAAFLSCAASSCPEVIQRDCAQWVADVDARIPTVIITATDSAGRDVVYVKLLVDGVPFTDRLDGIAVPIDPGIHVFRFEPANGPPLEQTVVLREAEKFQKQHFVLPAPTPVAKVAVLPRPPPRGEEPPAPQGSAWKTGAIVSASITGAAALSFATFALVGYIDVQDLNGSCSMHCSPSSVERANHELMAADISLGVGVAALAVTTWLYLEWRAHKSSPPGAGARARLPSLTLRF